MLFLSSGQTLGERLKSVILPKKIPFFGLEVSPSLYSALIVSVLLIAFALVVRIFIIPKFNDTKPSTMQLMLEGIVGYFDKTTNESSHRHKSIIAPYLFTAATYICVGTLIEMFGIRPVFADINACVALAVLSFFQVVVYNLINKGWRGILATVKDFTLPISFSFRLFGSILSGYMVMELVYAFLALSFVLPAFLSIVFTLFHAFIQAYVFATLSSLFIGESTEPRVLKSKG